MFSLTQNPDMLTFVKLRKCARMKPIAGAFDSRRVSACCQASVRKLGYAAHGARSNRQHTWARGVESRHARNSRAGYFKSHQEGRIPLMRIPEVLGRPVSQSSDWPRPSMQDDPHDDVSHWVGAMEVG